MDLIEHVLNVYFYFVNNLSGIIVLNFYCNMSVIEEELLGNKSLNIEY